MDTRTNRRGNDASSRPVFFSSFLRFLVPTMLFVLLAGFPPAARAQRVAIVGGTVHPVNGPPIENGVVIFDNGRITAVGPAGALPLPDDVQRIDAAGKVVTPGFFDAATATGLVEVGSVASTRDNALSGDPIQAAFRVTDGINPNSVVIPVTRIGGVTTVASIPSGGAISGQGAVLDLRGETVGAMLVRDGAAMYASFNPGGASGTGGGRGGLSLRLREAFEDAHAYAEHQDAFDRGATRDFAVSRLDLDALQPVLDGSIPLVVRASRASDIDAALRVAREYGARPVILGGEEAWMRADTLAQLQVPVILKPLSNLPVQFDRLGTRFDNGPRLADAGVPVVISTMDTHNARNLRYEAGNAIRFGMTWDAALRAVTLTPAEVLGVADTHGSLEPGKVANVVIWSGDPFAFSSYAERVFIRGQEIPATSRQKHLLERYKTLEGRPVQYRGKQGGR
ncbi:MAG: amidohydrolase family protein [Rhodothermales bacterium]